MFLDRRRSLISTAPGEIDDAARLWLRLRHTTGMNRARCARLIERFESPEAVLGASSTDLCQTKGIREELARSILDGRLAIDLDEEADLVEQYRVRIVTRADEDYPENLKNMSDAPTLLYFVGELEDDDRYAVTVVGTRSATGYARSVAEEIAGGLADAGLTVVSGLARGIDSAAHSASLNHGGRTLAVMGCGLRRIYPAENEQLAWKISQSGALMTEYAMATPPDKYNFPERNRILAGLSLGVVVVEAPARSGALYTARDGLDMGRCVYAVPGDVTRANSRGGNGLIREGATLIRDASDVIEDLHDALVDLIDRREKAGETPAAKTETVEALTFEESQIYELAREDASHFDELFEKARARGVDIDPARLSTILLQMEVKGLIRQAPGKMFIAETPAAYNAEDPAEQDAAIERDPPGGER